MNEFEHRSEAKVAWKRWRARLQGCRR